MALASVKEPVSFNDHGKELTQSKGLAKIFGYMGLGLLISGIICVGLSAILTSLDLPQETKGAIYFGLIIGSFFVILIDSLLITRAAVKGSGMWFPYILYTIAMGVFLSGFLITGISFATLGIAFGITSVIFLILFLVGYFSKANLNVLGFAVMGILGVISFSCLVFIPLSLLIPSVFPIWYLALSIGIGLFVIVITAVDAYNIRKIVERGGATKNILLFCAFQMYSDFIMILIRVLLIIARFSRN